MSTLEQDISVIITFGDDAREALSSVRSVLRYGPKAREIILASRGSSPATLHKMKSFADPLDAIQLSQYPAAFSEAKVRNLAAKKAKAGLLFFMDSTIRFHRGSKGVLERMAQRSAEPRTGAIGCLVLAKDKMTIRQTGVFKLPNQPFHILYFGYRLSQTIRLRGLRTFPYDIQHSRAVLALAGPFLVSRKAFRASTGFDEKYGLDVARATIELCLRLNRAKKQSWYSAGGSLLDYSASPVYPLDLPLRLSIIDTTTDDDPYLPKLSKANLRVPRAKRPAGQTLLRIFRRGPAV